MTISLINIINEGLIPGDETKKKTPAEVMQKWGCTIDTLKQKLKKGIAVEKEHSTDPRVAAEITLAHLWEDLHYYEDNKHLEELDMDKIWVDKEKGLWKDQGGKVHKGDEDGSIDSFYEQKGLDLQTAMVQAQQISKKEGVAQHVNQISDDTYEVSDWYDNEKTVCSYENGLKLNEKADSGNEEITGAIINKQFAREYPHIGHSLTDKQVEQWYKRHQFKPGTSMRIILNYLADWILSQGMEDDIQLEQPNETLDGQIIKMIKQGVGTPPPQRPEKPVREDNIIKLKELLSSEDLSKKFPEVVSSLTSNKIPCTVKLAEDRIIVELGYNYPDELAEKVFDACQQLGVPTDKYDVCAESSGHKIISSQRVNGGPKRYSSVSYGKEY